MIVNACMTDFRKISSGSLAEGLDFPGSDIDIMYICNDIDVVDNVSNIKHPIQRMTCVMETEFDHPGFTSLRVKAKGEGLVIVDCQCSPGTCSGEWLYLPPNEFSKKYMNRWSVPLSLHGPCLSNQNHTIDMAFCVRSKYLPRNASSWAIRHRWQWPPNFVIDRILNYGCLLVPIGPKTLSDHKSNLWRISFSVAEKILVHSFNFTQLLCYGLLKLMLKRIINTHDEVKDLMCSYFLKTALFWVSEGVNINTFQLSKIYYCFFLCVDKIILWVKKCYCPNYFIPEHNMFLGKINQSNNKILLCVLDSIMFGGIDGLLNSLFAPDNEHTRLVCTNNESSFIRLDFLLYRMFGTCNLGNINSGPECPLRMYNGLAITESLLKSESSSFIVDICKYYVAIISKHIAQQLPSPNTIGEAYNIRNIYQRYLKNVIKTDALSGWLLYASYYYVTGQFDVTLRLTDYVLSKCSPNRIGQGSQFSEICFQKYRYNVHSSMTLNERVTLATVTEVKYVPRSSLIPEELTLDVEHHFISISPCLMSHCLRFLCFHHRGDISNRQLALRNIYLAVNGAKSITKEKTTDSLTILGVCNEISGYKDEAYECYDQAFFYSNCKCSDTEKRKLKLLDI
ncbi:uncharacterized protein LOC134689686 [Mytilus trossulus]|uniref:uncharacterized protein LOC134689686 n=1 Tax=Mytilus trossulus TaxID=6551 RepID=UPI0030056BDA